VQDLDGSRGDWGLVAMHDVFDPVPVADNRVGFGNLAVDSGHARFERVSLRVRGRPLNLHLARSRQSERD
jgi:hypothetical protein